MGLIRGEELAKFAGFLFYQGKRIGCENMGITFSFIIPTYNSKKTIIRAIESVSQQLDKSEYEIIIVEDGSQD